MTLSDKDWSKIVRATGQFSRERALDAIRSQAQSLVRRVTEGREDPRRLDIEPFLETVRLVDTDLAEQIEEWKEQQASEWETREAEGHSLLERIEDKINLTAVGGT